VHSFISRGWLVLFVGLAFVAAARADQSADPTVYVLLWFDTEDYLLPADDDATLHISEFLTREGVHCTHKLVGEKARVLDRRGRRDVIAALQKHEIGYHTDYHSVQPTPALFLSRLGWDEGVVEFDRRERQGLLDVERITGQRPTCYGQPGSSWGPQQFGAMRRWGMRVYLDAGSHVALDGNPFWYCGVLNLYALKATLRTSLGGPQDLKQAVERFDAAYDELLAAGGGPVSIYYHPCEFVHAKFWDGVNFAKGANPPRSAWQVPPQKSAAETAVAYKTFEDYIRHIKTKPRVRFITATEALALYEDRAISRSFTPDDIKDIARSVVWPNGVNSIPRRRNASSLGRATENEVADDEVSFQVRGDYSLSAAETLALLNDFADAVLRGKATAAIGLRNSPLGPTAAAPTHEVVETDRSQMDRTIADVAGYMDRHDRVPNAVWLGSTPVSPESYLKTLARYVTKLAAEPGIVKGDAGPPVRPSGADVIRFAPTRLRPADHVAAENSKLWGWVIFPADFRAPEMMELARRQAWTLKPAVLERGRR